MARYEKTIRTGNDGADDDVGRLRTALKEAQANGVSAEKMIALAKKHAGYKDKDKDFMSARALRTFIMIDSATLKKVNYDLLAAMWLNSRLGRTLRNLDQANARAFDDIAWRLSHGAETMPARLQVSGRYFMYHGSYLESDRFVIRRLVIDDADDRVLTVHDLVRDELAPKLKDRRASGVMLFEDGTPQILLYGEEHKENKRGLSLIIGHKWTDEDDRLDTIFGSFIVMSGRGQVAYRHCLIVREEELTEEEMTGETGIFKAEQLRKLKRNQHRAALDRLKELIGRKGSVDPMLSYGGLVR